MNEESPFGGPGVPDGKSSHISECTFPPPLLGATFMMPRAGSVAVNSPPASGNGTVQDSCQGRVVLQQK